MGSAGLGLLVSSRERSFSVRGPGAQRGQRGFVGGPRTPLDSGNRRISQFDLSDSADVYCLPSAARGNRSRSEKATTRMAMPTRQGRSKGETR
jgi:hypothetical protein